MPIRQVTILQDELSGLWKVVVADDDIVEFYFADSDDALALSKLLEKATSMICFTENDF